MDAATVVGCAPVATEYKDCLRECAKCGVGASNARNPRSVTFIFRDPLQSIPIQSREGADETLRNSLNVRNRQSKRTRFGFVSSSEDAVTWVVFTYLLRSGRLANALGQIGVPVAGEGNSEPTLLLWGAPVDAGAAGEQLQARLKSLCVGLGENPQSLSEPDVVVDLGATGLVFIEVKHRSGNDRKKDDYTGWGKYFAPSSLGWSPDGVKASGCYELARNWCLVNGLAAGRRAFLVNLGSPRLFAEDEGKRLDGFVSSLGQEPKAQFVKATWDQFLSDVLSDAPDWFKEFCSSWRVTG
jgi:hypothetical protein